MTSKKIIKKVVMCATCGLLLFSNISPNVVYAATTDTQVEDIADIDSGDIIYHTDMTHRTEENPSQITGNFEIPSQFKLNTYVRFQGENDKKIYQITASEDNGYNDYGFFPYQKYTVIECGIVDDNTSTYPCSVANGTTFETTADESAYTIKITLDNYDEIKNTIDERTKTITDNTDATTEKEDKTLQGLIDRKEVYATGLKDVYKTTDGVLYYDFDTKSEHGHLYATGNCIQDLDLLIKITSDGVIGEAQFAASMDNGKTFTNPTYTANTVSLGSSKMTLNFVLDEGKTFKKGDTFKAHLYQTTKVSQISNPEANVVVVGNPEKKQELQISFLIDGKKGKGKFQLLNTKKQTDKIIDTIPENGVYKYNNVKLYFSDAEFNTTQTMTCSLKSFTQKQPILPFVIIIGGIILAIFIYFQILKKNKENMNDYKLHTYIDKQSADKY